MIAIEGSARRTGGRALLWIGLAGKGGGRELTSASTQQRGLVVSIDVAPTALRWLDLPVPAAMRGRPITTKGTLDAGALARFLVRLDTVQGRRTPALVYLLIGWGVLFAGALLAGRASGRDARGARGGGRAAALGALAVMWAPVMVLVGAAIEPGAVAEELLIAAGALVLGALTEWLVPWPHALAVPAAASLAALTADALAGTQLFIRSVLGPDPAFGARFYGIGNELKSGLAVLAFAGVAAALHPAGRSRTSAYAMAGAGFVLAVIEGSARIGAGVGGVILVCAGAAVATVLLLPGRVRPLRVIAVVAAPLLGLVVLAALDLAFAGGNGHFTGSVLHARSAADLRDLLKRRYTAAWNESTGGLMPLATAIALLAAAAAVRFSDRVYRSAPQAVWRAALAGGLTSGIVGALSEDSGTVLLVTAVFVLACVTAYLWAAPPAIASRARSARISASTLEPTPPKLVCET